MEKMKQLQESRDDVKASQEEKATRFEKEKRESMLVCCSGMYVKTEYLNLWYMLQHEKYTLFNLKG